MGYKGVDLGLGYGCFCFIIFLFFSCSMSQLCARSRALLTRNVNRQQVQTTDLSYMLYKDEVGLIIQR